MPSIAHHIIGLNRAFGTIKTAEILCRRAVRASAAMSIPVSVGAKTNRPVLLRPTDSDLFVASQVFGWQEYSLPKSLTTSLSRLAQTWRSKNIVPVIVDAGANAGYSALYFSALFPEAEIIAIEPNPASFNFLMRNVSQCKNIRAIEAALWSHENGVDLEFPNSGSWSVRAIKHQGTDERPLTQSTTLEGILRTVPGGRMLICKLDIEGAERDVCRASAKTLQTAACVIVETHDFLFEDGGCHEAVTDALISKMPSPIRLGENWDFVNPEVAFTKT